MDLLDGTDYAPWCFDSCAYCGEPILVHEKHVQTAEGLIHFDCAKDYIFDSYDAEELCSALELEVGWD